MNGKLPAASQPTAASGKQVIADLLAAGERLIAAIEQENDVLRRRQTERLAAVGNAKRAASRSYEEAFAALLGLGPEGIAAHKTEKAALTPMAERLKQAAAENEQRLRVAITASRRVLDAVADAVKDVSAGPKTYSRGGTYGANRASRSASVAISVNRTL